MIKNKKKLTEFFRKEKLIKEAALLRKQGYLRTSNKYCSLSRIDREDWNIHMAISHSPWSLDCGLRWVEVLGNDAEDHYRRCYSKDKITVSEELSKLVGSSSWKTIGFKSLNL